MIEKIVSGGQTGVDRAGLDVALELGYPCGGWCPKGRKAEDGALPSRYPLIETPTDDYAERTTWNVRDSDGTLILAHGKLTGGTAQTIDDAIQLTRPYLVVDLGRSSGISAVLDWLREQRIRILNVAGPRESKQPGIYREASQFLRELLARERPASPPSR